MATRNVTLTMPEEVFRQAKIYAAGHDTSVYALVAELLTGLISQSEADYARLWADELEFIRQSPMRIGDRMPTREEAH